MFFFRPGRPSPENEYLTCSWELVEAVRDHENLKDGGHVTEPPDVVDGRPEVEPLEHVRQGVEADHLSGAFGHDGAERLEAGQGSVPFQSRKDKVSA